MPRSGYSHKDHVTARSGYVAHDHEPTDHRGGPDSYSNRINHTRMNERASHDTFPASLDPRSPALHIPRGRLYSSTADDLSGTPPRDDLYRSQPSQEYERRTRGYTPGYYGERVSRYSSNPQLGGVDHGYRDERHWPCDSPINKDSKDYKRDEERGVLRATAYQLNEGDWNESRSSTRYRIPHLRDEDGFDQRQSRHAAEVSGLFHSASEKRIEHNNNYIGHWPREKRKGHKDAVGHARDDSTTFTNESHRHRDSHWRRKWKSDLDKYYPEDDE